MPSADKAFLVNSTTLERGEVWGETDKAMEDLAQLVFGFLQPRAVADRKALACAVDVEGQHRHG